MPSAKPKRDGYAIKRGDAMPGGYAAYCECCQGLYTVKYFLDCWGDSCRCPKCREVRVDWRPAKGKPGPKPKPLLPWSRDLDAQQKWDAGGD